MQKNRITSQALSSPITRLRAKLPPPLHPLADLALNLWWSWSPERLSIFRDIDPQQWEQCHHNPVKFLETVSDEQLTHVAIKPGYLQRVQVLADQFESYRQQTNTWANRVVPQLTQKQPVAYFCVEFGLHPSLPIYAGGLGILAGDHLKSASDLGLPLVAVGLLYRQGNFPQRLNSQGWQEDYYLDYQFETMPLELLCDQHSEPLTIEVEMRSRCVKAQVWQVQVGRVNLYLLDTNREDNHPIDRWITGQVYGGQEDTTLAQEVLLGIGGIRVLQRLGLEPTVYHLNEGNAAFAPLELARQEMERTGQSFQEVEASVRERFVFTTHTPIPAGNDTFSSELIDSFLAHYWSQLGLEREEFLNLGNHLPEEFGERFNMTVLALRLSRSANGVSQINGEVCRQMWSVLYPDRSAEQVPINSITNGVHAQTWTAPLMADLYSQYLDKDWAAHVTEKQMWAKVDEIPDQEIWWRHQRLKEHLIAYTRSEVKRARTNRGEASESIEAAEQLLDSQVLTIGFARRFSTYKRADLITYDPQRILQILSNPEWPVQIIFSGKAHPADEMSKHLIHRVIEWSHDSDLQNRVVFIEDYDILTAQKLVQGVDVWLNTPRRPKEASGTSGQKACFNGGINCSILDGWWPEAYQVGSDGKGLNGWAIGEDCHTDDQEAQDQLDAESLYRLLNEEIVPLYYDRDAEGLPRRWIGMMKASIKTVAPVFNTDRMLAQYVTQMYLPSLASGESLLKA